MTLVRSQIRAIKMRTSNRSSRKATWVGVKPIPTCTAWLGDPWGLLPERGEELVREAPALQALSLPRPSVPVLLPRGAGTGKAS